MISLSLNDDTAQLRLPGAGDGDEPDNLVVAVYGVGGGSAKSIREDVLRALAGRFDFARLRGVEVLDWNDVSPHWRGGPHLDGGASWFSDTFVKCAYYRIEHQGRVLGAATLALQIALALIVAILYVALAVAFQGLAVYLIWKVVFPLLDVSPPFAISAADFESAGIAVLDYIRLPLRVLASSAAVAMIVALSIAIEKSVLERSSEPLWMWLRWQLFVVCLAPAVALSTVLHGPLLTEGSGTGPVRWVRMPAFWWNGAALLMLRFFLGGDGRIWRTTIGAVGVIFFGLLVSRLRWRSRAAAQRVWLVAARTLLDVSIYIGAPKYRAAIREALRNIVMSRTGKKTTIWFVAHSLGSVIVFDSLLNDHVWTRSQSVVLLTCGSPLRRLFSRFYPDLFFPANLKDAAGLIAARVASFRWVNVYRPLDYIGKSVGFGISESVVNTWWPCHTGYWSDPQAIEASHRLLDECTAIEPHRERVIYDAKGILEVPSRVQAWSALVGWLWLPLAAVLLFSLRHWIPSERLSTARMLGAYAFLAAVSLSWSWMATGMAQLLLWVAPGRPYTIRTPTKRAERKRLRGLKIQERLEAPAREREAQEAEKRFAETMRAREAYERALGEPGFRNDDEG